MSAIRGGIPFGAPAPGSPGQGRPACFCSKEAGGRRERGTGGELRGLASPPCQPSGRPPGQGGYVPKRRSRRA